MSDIKALDGKLHRRILLMSAVTVLMLVTALVSLILLIQHDDPTPIGQAINKCLAAPTMTLLGVEDDGSFVIAWASADTIEFTDGFTQTEVVGLPAEVVFPTNEAEDIRDVLRGALTAESRIVELETTFEGDRIVTTGIGLRENLLAVCTEFPDD